MTLTVWRIKGKKKQPENKQKKAGKKQPLLKNWLSKLFG